MGGGLVVGDERHANRRPARIEGARERVRLELVEPEHAAVEAPGTLRVARRDEGDACGGTKPGVTTAWPAQASDATPLGTS